MKTPLTLAHFGFDTKGDVLSDVQLPATLTAEWRDDEANQGRPFPSYARMLTMRGRPEGENRCSWTVDFAERRARARAERQPFLDEAALIKATVVDLKEQLKRWKKDKAAQSKRDTLETDIREKEKAARELENKAAGIEAAVFDLKAVNPNAVTRVDVRTPQEIIGNIEAQGRIIEQALAKLTLLLVEPD